MPTKLVVVDTSALMQSLKVVEETAKENKLVITSIVLEELDKHKDCNDPNRSFKSRQALKFINNNEDKIEFSLLEIGGHVVAFEGLDPEKYDNKILAVAFNLKAAVLTYDIGMKVKAKKLGLEVIDTYEYDEDYKGYIVVEGFEAISSFYEDVENKEIELLTNQYVILKEEGTKDKVLRWDGRGLVTVNVPHYAKALKAKNSLQLAALDIMFNPNIPIKVICGQYGSGKTFLAVKASKLMLDEGKAEKMLLVRNPVPADGIDIGALPGDKNDKVGSYFKPMLQYLDTDFDMFDPENEKKGQAVECEIVSFMKGISVDHTIMIVDEAEDLNLKLLKMVGTRIGDGSSVVFTGDYKQSEARYRADNGLSLFIEKCKGNPLVGIIVLEEDVRSEASKVFADL
jgi:predicted ribonuclease YlaK